MYPVKTLIKPCKGLKHLWLSQPAQTRGAGENANKTLQGIKTNVMLKSMTQQKSENANKTLQGIKTQSAIVARHPWPARWKR